MPFTTPRLTQLSLTNLRYGVNHGNTPMKEDCIFCLFFRKTRLGKYKNQIVHIECSREEMDGSMWIRNLAKAQLREQKFLYGLERLQYFCH